MGAVASTLPALAVALPVRGFFEAPGATGRILASFDRSVYVETSEGQLVAILAESLGRGAFALTVGKSPSFAALQPDDAVIIEDRTLRVGDLRVDLTSGAPWDPTLPPLDAPADDGMRTLEAHLRSHGPSDGLSPVMFKRSEGSGDPLLRRGHAALDGLRHALSQGDPAALTAAVTQLAGLGPGLTPSGDDLMAGLLLALRLWPEAAGPLGAKIAATLILGTAVPRTGRISRAYLWAARQGHAADAWHDLVRALPAPPGPVTSAASRILQTGETSGADMLAGFLFGWKLTGRA